MSNTISYDSNPNIENLHMSNGSTSVFISVLGLSGSKLAKFDYEKDLIIYLLEKDQSVVGLGTLYFDVIEMPWQKDYFYLSKIFLLKVIDNAKLKTNWELLDYTPNQELVFNFLDTFELMIKNLEFKDIDFKSSNEWITLTYQERKTWNIKYPKCKKHSNFITCFGRHICNDKIL